MPVLQRVISIAWNVDGTMNIGFDKQEERYEVAKAREVAAIVEEFRPTVVLVREKEKTLLRLHQSAPALFSPPTFIVALLSTIASWSQSTLSSRTGSLGL